MSNLLCNVLKFSGGGQMPQMPPPGCAPAKWFWWNEVFV